MALAELRLKEAKIIAGILNRKFEYCFDKELYLKNFQADKKHSIYRVSQIGMLSQINGVCLVSLIVVILWGGWIIYLLKSVL